MRHDAIGLAIIVLAGCRGNLDAPPGRSARLAPTDGMAPTAVVASATARPMPPLDCGQATAIDVVVPVKNITDVSDLAVAATRDRAHVTFAVNGDHGCVVDGCYVYHDAFQVTVTADGRASTITKPPAAAVGVSPSVDAVPFVLGDTTHVLTQGHGGSAPQPMPGDDAPDTLYIVLDGKILKRSRKWFSGAFAVQGSGDTALAVGAGLERAWYVTGMNDGAASLRVFRIPRDGEIAAELIQASPPGNQGAAVSQRYFSPAIAFDGAHASIAVRHAADKKAEPHLLAGWIDPKTGKLSSTLVDVAHGDIGAPAVLLDRTTTHIVWAERERAGAAYRLRHATWEQGTSAPTPATTIPTLSATALSPSLARLGRGVVLAWMDAADTKHGAIWAGYGETLDDAARAARVRSTPDVTNARDPRWAVAGDRAVLAWSEHDGPRRVRVAWCPAP